MKLNKVIAGCIIATQIAGCATIQWSKADTVRQLAFTSLLVVDWVQTRNNASDGWQGVKELNPILGSKPDTTTVDLYILGAMLGHFAVSIALPPKYRSHWQMFWIGVETCADVNNELVRRRE
jgi:predicted secreted Zn-dependent protease